MTTFYKIDPYITRVAFGVFLALKLFIAEIAQLKH